MYLVTFCNTHIDHAVKGWESRIIPIKAILVDFELVKQDHEATDPHPINSPIMFGRPVCKDPETIFFFKTVKKL